LVSKKSLPRQNISIVALRCSVLQCVAVRCRVAYLDYQKFTWMRGSSRLHDSYFAMSDHDSYMCHDPYNSGVTERQLAEVQRHVAVLQTQVLWWYDSCTCVIWLISMCDMTQLSRSKKCRGTSQCYKRRYVGDMVRANVWYDLFLCVTWLIYMWAQRSAEARRSITNAGTSYCIWSVISSFSIHNWWSSSLGLFYHVPSKRDQGNWDWREKCRGTSQCCKRRYGVATISRLLKIIGLFCKI